MRLRPLRYIVNVHLPSQNGNERTTDCESCQIEENQDLRVNTLEESWLRVIRSPQGSAQPCTLDEPIGECKKAEVKLKKLALLQSDFCHLTSAI